MVVRRAFSLIELLVVIAIVALLVLILLPALAEARRAGRKAVCMSNQRQFSIGYAGYASDYRDRIASYSWQPGGRYSRWTQLNVPSNADQALAARYQMADIARRLTGRENILPEQPDTFIGLLPHAVFNHLPMNDYYSHNLPAPLVACPEDNWLIGKQRDAFSGIGVSDNRKWSQPYSSSYFTVAAGYSPDMTRGNPYRETVYPAANVGHIYVYAGNTVLSRRTLSEVRLPAQKVSMFEQIARHGKKPDYHAYPDVVQPVLFWDSSMRDVRSGDAQAGEDPNAPWYWNESTLLIKYLPNGNVGEPPSRNPKGEGDQAFEYVEARYQWTRNGLNGFDIGGDRP